MSREDKINLENFRREIEIRKLIEEDNSLCLEKNNETNEMILMGLGDMHLDITVQKLKAKYKLSQVQTFCFLMLTTNAKYFIILQ